MASVPPRVRFAYRFTLNGVEYLLADVRRERMAVTHADSLTDHPVDQRLLLAERRAGDAAAPFRAVWHHYDFGLVDDHVQEEPAMLLRL